MLSAGGCDFARDPDSPADRDALFWIPSLQPAVIMLAASLAPLAPAAMPVNLMRLPGIDLRAAEDGWHAFWWRADAGHQFWLPEMPRDAAQTYAVTLSFDAFFDLRIHVARRLWRVTSNLSP